MISGELRDSLVIQSATATADASGEPIKTWTTFATVPVKAVKMSGHELEKAQKINGVITTRFDLRYLAGVTNKMRGQWESKNWNIHFIANDPRKFNMTLYASEII